MINSTAAFGIGTCPFSHMLTVVRETPTILARIACESLSRCRMVTRSAGSM